MIDLSRIPTVTKYLLIINISFFVLQNLFPQIDQYFALRFFQSPDFRPYQLLTHMFMHGSLFHLFFNMYALYMFGQIIEINLGDKKFLTFYLLTGFGAVLLHSFIEFIQFQNIVDLINSGTATQQDIYQYSGYMNNTLMGASGALFGILAGFVYLYPNHELQFIFIPIPIKSKYLLAGYAALELFNGIQNAEDDNIAHFAHLGGALFGFLILREWRKKNMI